MRAMKTEYSISAPVTPQNAVKLAGMSEIVYRRPKPFAEVAD